MTLQSNLLIQHIENLLTICQATLGSEDAKRLQQQHFQFQHVDANELLLLEITHALRERIADDTIMSYFRNNAVKNYLNDSDLICKLFHAEFSKIQ
ncbi:hypothetical protein [Alishewanella longhuensis]